MMISEKREREKKATLDAPVKNTQKREKRKTHPRRGKESFLSFEFGRARRRNASVIARVDDDLRFQAFDSLHRVVVHHHLFELSFLSFV